MNGYTRPADFRAPLKQQPPWEELIRQQLEQTQAEQRNKKLLLQLEKQKQQLQRKKIDQKQEILKKYVQQCASRMRQSTTTTDKMAVYLVCLTAGGGVPLFTRKTGDLKALPFPVVGSINGVHMFARNKDVTLLSTATSDAQVTWKVFHDSIILILVTSRDATSDSDGDSNCGHASRLLHCVFDAMVLLVGLDDLVRVKNVERLKKDLRCCYRLIDTLLDQEDVDHCLFGQMTRSVDCLVTPHNQVLQNHLESFVQGLGTTYGCLLVRGRLVVATAKWWTLSPSEAALLAVFISASCPPMTTRDIPVFLPVESPSVPHRLATFCLYPGVEVCVLCGPTPTIAEMERDVVKYWRNCQEALKQVSKLYPRNFSQNVSLDKNIFGFLLMNVDSRRCLCSVQQQTADEARTETKCSVSVKKRQRILRAFCKSTLAAFFPDKSTDTNTVSKDAFKVYHTRLKHRATETYVATDSYKGYALYVAPYLLFVVYDVVVPNFALRSTTQHTLQLLTKDKNLHI